MPKTRKQTRRHRRRTLKHRKHRKGGSLASTSQPLIPPTDAMKVSVPEPSNKIV